MTLVNKIKKIIAEKIENREIEFKKCKNKIGKSFWETYSAFANTSGGIIILGYDQDNDEIQGIEDINKIKDDLFTTANDSKKVNRNLLTDDHVEVIEIEDKALLVVKVDEALYTQKPVYLNESIELTYIRRNSADIKAKGNDLANLISNSVEEMDGDILKDFDIYDFNEDTINYYKELLAQKFKNEEFLNMSHEEFLIDIGAYRKDRTGDKKYKPTKGALLLFGKLNSILEIFPSFQLDYFEKDSSLENRWDDRVTTGDMSNINVNNILDFYRVVNQKIIVNTKDKFVLDSSNRRLPFKEDLAESVREALVNSLMHASYNLDFPIKITAFKDYYEFENPGKMRVTKEEFITGKTSRLRNHIIANLFKKVGIAEKGASGGYKIFRTAKKYKLKTPELINELDKTIIRLWKVDISHTFKELSELEQEIMYAIMEKGVVSKSEINSTPHKSRKALENLIKKNLIVKIGNSRATKYTLPNDSTENYIMIKNLLRIIDDSIDKI